MIFDKATNLQSQHKVKSNESCCCLTIFGYQFIKDVYVFQIFMDVQFAPCGNFAKSSKKMRCPKSSMQKKEREEEKFEDIQHVKRKEQPLRNMRVYM